jgi:hypothetical protein
LEHGLEAPNDVVHIQHPKLGDLLPAEREQLLRHHGRPLGGLLDIDDVLPHRGRQRRIAQHEGGHAEDHRHLVVRLVGDATGQPADCLQPVERPEVLLARPERLLRPLPLGDIGDDGDQAEHRAVRT